MSGNVERSELGRAPVGRLLIRMSIPATLGMIVNGLYNLVDTIFIGRGVGTEAIGGLALALPAQMMIMTIGLSIGQGAASVVSRNLGSGDDDRACRAAGNAFGLSLFFGMAILVLGTVFLDELLNLLGATEALRIHAHSYLSIILAGSPFIALAMCSNNLLRSEGKAKASMTTMLIGIVANIILDPFFIFVLKLGVAGAAWATVIGQFLAFLYSSWWFIARKTIVKVHIKHWLIQTDVIREIIVLGIPAFIRQSGQSVLTVILNNLLAVYGGDIYITAYGVINRLLMFLLMPLFGTVQGFQPIAGFNYGAKLFHRVRRILSISLIYATIYTSAGFIVLFFFPRFFAGIFTTDVYLLDTIAYVMRFIVAAFPLIGFQIIGSTYFMVIGKSLPSLILNLSRQILFCIPLILILPQFFGMTGILVSFPIADCLAAVLTLICLRPEVKKLV